MIFLPIRPAGALGLAVALLAAGCRSHDIKTLPPEVSVVETGAPVLRVDLPASYVSAPVVFDLRPVLAGLEETVPRVIGSVEKEKRIKVHSGPSIWIAPELTRGPLQFSFKDNTVTVFTTFEYRTRAWAKLLLVEHSVSCGIEGPRPRMRLQLTVTYDIAPDWTLRTTSHLDRLEPISEGERDQCEISFAKVNVTPKVADAAREALEGALKKADHKLTHVSLAKPIGGIWQTLQRPISISKGTLWLQIQPRTVSLNRVAAEDSTLTAHVSLLASPRLASGPRPPDGTDPLPALGRGAGGADTALVYIEGLLVYAAANSILNQALVGKSVKVGWRRVKVETVAALPGGGGKVILGITLRGKARGTIYVVGTPSYDRATDLITLPDLSFDVRTSTALGATVGWLIEGPLLGLIREHARIPASALLDEAVALANREINRTLSDGVFLRGQLAGAETRAVHATREGVMAQAHARGRLWVEIAKEDLLPGTQADQ
ncbi:MAG TPA: DUF4403 family protein [Gemmatimonadales bacterium]|nr:DUF4403 family protein [Gemmatimonadales bacterium]